MKKDLACAACENFDDAQCHAYDDENGDACSLLSRLAQELKVEEYNGVSLYI